MEPATNFFVGRTKRDLRGGQSFVGAMVTAVNRRLNTPELRGGLAAWREPYNPIPYETPSSGGLMVREQPIHAYAPSAPGPIARASALGRYRHLPSGSQEFARAKEAEIAREDRVRR